jgi:hypothetical protein
MNPDSDINVVAVFPNGIAKVYGPVPKGSETARRPLLFINNGFVNYGQAKLWADEYEDRARAARVNRGQR